MLKLVSNAWQSPRIMRMGLHRSSTVLFATYGLPAGRAFADVTVRAFAIAEYDQYVQRNPGVDFMSYIDDAGARGSGKDRDVLAVSDCVSAAPGDAQ